MAELRPIPLVHLLRRVLDEPARQQSLFDLPLRKCWRPSPNALDLSVDVHGHRAQTPVGPAAGPHAQLAQNIVLSWLAGSRVIELKTVQILDELQIPRPCIDAATIGFNVEWSQELRLHESLREYVAGWLLIRILRHLDPIGLGPAAAAAHPVFELSVGYDLKGLQQPAMRDYLRRARDVTPILDELRAEVAAVRPDLAGLDVPAEMISCVTLSTFHGCPPGEIEAIAKYLLDEHDVDVIVKLNPTLLGYDEVTHILHDRLGYRELRPRAAAFETDLHFDEALALARRLDRHAAARGRRFGVKMTNTLVVENHKTFFGDEVMYLSGEPLHVLAMTCVDRFREALGADLPLSFSGGIDQHNAADAVACDLVPVTTCTDLLRAGGYGRLPKYLDNLEKAMRACGARDRDELILRRFGHAAEAARRAMAKTRARLDHHPGDREALARRLAAVEDALVAAAADAAPLRDAIAACTSPENGASSDLATLLSDLPARVVREAGALNSREVAARVAADPRYAAAANSKPPRKVGSRLVLLDCLSCDKCVPVCPNDANFALPTPPCDEPFDDVVLDGPLPERRPAAGRFRAARPEQWANFADACNDCGNCDVFCPEDGGPYLMKARFFGSREGFAANAALDGLFIEERGRAIHVSARLGGAAYELRVPPTEDEPAVLEDARLRAFYDPRTGALLRAEAREATDTTLPHTLSGAVFLTLRALVRGALDPARMNPVSARLPSLRWPA